MIVTLSQISLSDPSMAHAIFAMVVQSHSDHCPKDRLQVVLGITSDVCFFFFNQDKALQCLLHMSTSVTDLSLGFFNLKNFRPTSDSLNGNVLD